jgi:allantoin racemase
MNKVLVVVPFAFDPEGGGMENREAQMKDVALGPDISFDFRGVKAGPALFDSYHDWTIADLALFEAGKTAQDEGYAAVCIDTMSDSGMNGLRSVLDIPVVGPGRCSYLTALMLGSTFSVLTQWDPWIGLYKKGLAEYGLADKCASIRSINTPPDVENLLGGKEEVVFPKLHAAAVQCIEEDGAEVICMGSTTMHQAVPYLRENLPVPVINPGPLTYKLAEFFIGLGLSHSRKAYAKPNSPKLEMMEAMLLGAAAHEAAAV